LEFLLGEVVPEVEDAIQRGLQMVILKALPNSGKKQETASAAGAARSQRSSSGTSGWRLA
jgi:hypothetical protein